MFGQFRSSGKVYHSNSYNLIIVLMEICQSPLYPAQNVHLLMVTWIYYLQLINYFSLLLSIIHGFLHLRDLFPLIFCRIRFSLTQWEINNIKVMHVGNWEKSL